MHVSAVSGRLVECLKQMILFAKAHKGKCLAESYIDCDTPILFACEQHGSFLSKPRHITNGHWCRKCRDEKHRPAIMAKLEKYIAERGGKLKSAYINARSHVTVECSIHGEWLATPDNLVNKRSWCSRCMHSLPRKKRSTNNVRIPILI